MTSQRPKWAYTLPAALLLLAPFDILASLAMDIYLPIVPAMPGILNTTPAVIQLTLSLYMVMLGLGQIVFGPISDRIGRRPVLLIGVAVFIVTSLGAAWPLSTLHAVSGVGHRRILGDRSVVGLSADFLRRTLPVNGASMQETRS